MAIFNYNNFITIIIYYTIIVYSVINNYNKFKTIRIYNTKIEFGYI